MWDRILAMMRGTAEIGSSRSPNGVVPDDNRARKEEEIFRRQVTERVFQNAERSSELTYQIARIFFWTGIVLGIILISGILYLLWISYPGNSQPDRLVEQLNAQLLSPLQEMVDRNQYIPASDVLLLMWPLIIAIARDVLVRHVIPILGLGMLAVLMYGFLHSAVGLARRRVVQEALAELGPLQALLAGIPPRKPMLQVVEQGFGHTRRAFVLRMWLTQASFAAALLLLVVTVAHALWPGSKGLDDWLKTAAVGGTSLLAWIFSKFAQGQVEVRETLQDITEREMRLALTAQQSEIVELYVAQLLRSGSGLPNTAAVDGILALVKGLEEQHDRRLAERTAAAKSPPEPVQRPAEAPSTGGPEHGRPVLPT